MNTATASGGTAIKALRSAPMKLIQSRDNPFYKGLKRLAESGRERRKTGRTLRDGVHLVEAYEKACGPVETLIAVPPIELLPTPSFSGLAS